MSRIGITLALLLVSACSSSPTPTIAPTSPPATDTLLPPQTDTPVPPPAPTGSAAFGTPAAVPGVEIGIVGSETFVTQTNMALDLLAACVPDDLQIADGFLVAIQESDRSGMVVDRGVFLASEITAFAPGYSESAQVFWFASTIIHDAHHRRQAEQGMTTNWGTMSLEEREALEWDARAVQIEVMEKCGPTLPAEVEFEWTHLVQYLTDMQDGITQCDYCEVEWEDRNW